MTNALSFLQSLNDCEFLFVYVYKYNAYTDHGRQLLETERLKRQLNDWQVSDYMANTEFQLSNTGCVRCNSPKPLVRRKCVVCDHVLTPCKLVHMDGEEEMPGAKTILGLRVLGILFETVLEGLSAG